eukprot:TRINITY_DN12886_c0_g1_i1.p1 TRINITY_DN12886_c0_g1~~TRINITY_DN12886_c0_g1_i1.p1  ORF type:complete len:978 (+),score=135.56 TRINITY_DN12886_c0_g1_i1:80-3013(+)
MASIRWFLAGLIFLGLVAVVPLYFVNNIYFPQRAELHDASQELSSLKTEFHAHRAARQAETQALDRRVASLEALLKVIEDGQPQAIREKHQKAAALAQAEAIAEHIEEAKATQIEANKAAKKTWRDDDRCGSLGADSSGQPASCNPTGLSPCCSPAGWCGGSPDHCDCMGCTDFRPPPGGAKTQIPRPEPASPSHYVQSKPKRIALVVPFRDRGAHLERFRERIQAHAESWNSRGVKHHWHVFVAEQFDNQLFNRGYLFNVGLHYATEFEKKTGQQFDCVVMHDIDILPTPVVDYGWCLWPNQLSGEIECWNWGVPYPDNVGGVVSLSPQHWRAINGFSNEYEGWGGEDDDLYLRLKINNLLKGGCHTWCNSPKRPTVPMVYRPPIGQGRMTCLHDGDHTPRQRAPQDAPMWQRLNAMKANSPRWRNDGLTSLRVFSAGEPVESNACTACTAPEDPESKPRLFSEHWSRISQKPISAPSRIEVVRLPGSHGCGNASRPLPAIPAGLEQLRRLLPELFHGHCDMGSLSEWAHTANFILIDLTLGHAMLVGNGVQLVMPDSSLPALQESGAVAGPTPLPATEHLLQAQRLSRWIRKLPESHLGWIVVADEAMSVWQKRFFDSGRRIPLTSPACISKASMQGGSKFRVTAGTQWCGDGGWNHVGHFMVLRSKSNVPEDKKVPICISFNRNGYAYRFENSDAGCIGTHKPTQTTWVHAHTIYTSADAEGDEYCVGIHLAGTHTRWILQRGASCSSDGFVHSFSFRAMTSKREVPLAPCCLLSEASSNSAAGLPPLQRFATGQECGAGRLSVSDWKLSRKLVLLARRQSESDHRVCVATGMSTAKDDSNHSRPSQEHLVWRVFRDSACDRPKVVTYEGDRKFHWTMSSSPEVFLPSKASGVHLCLCHILPSAADASSASAPAASESKKSGKGGKPPARTTSNMPFYTWVESTCPEGAKRELCFNTLGPADVVEAVELIDEIV